MSGAPAPGSAKERRAAGTLAEEAPGVVAMQLGSATLPLVVGGLVGLATSSVPLGLVAFVATALIAISLVFRLLRLRAGAALEGERRWLASLPFEVSGWFDVLGAEPSGGRMKAILVFRGEAPDRPTLDGLAARLGGRLGQGTSATLESAEIDVSVEDSDRTSNRGYLRFQRALVRDVLLPLHEAYPLRAVRFGRA